MMNSDNLPSSGGELIKKSPISTEAPEFKEAVNIIGAHTSDSLLTGSYMFDPENAKDIDIVVVYRWSMSQQLQEHGFKITDHTEYPNNNLSACYRKGCVNIIACRDPETFNLWAKATSLALTLQLKEKFQRVMLFQFVTEGRIRGTELYYNAPPVVDNTEDPF